MIQGQAISWTTAIDNWVHGNKQNKLRNEFKILVRKTAANLLRIKIKMRLILKLRVGESLSKII